MTFTVSSWRVVTPDNINGSTSSNWAAHSVIGGKEKSEYNAKQKNASHYSQHLYGKAADIWIAGVSVDTLAAYVETLLPNRGGIGRYYNDNFVHVDVRTAKSRWKG